MSQIWIFFQTNKAVVNGRFGLFNFYRFITVVGESASHQYLQLSPFKEQRDIAMSHLVVYLIWMTWFDTLNLRSEMLH